MIHLLWLSLAIPIIIHLVHRRKAKPMPFSTLRFLQMVDQRVARRQRLRELLLLALRMLLLAALVGAIERPMLHSDTFKGTSVPTTVAIVLDNTASMQAVKQGASAFARAKTAALDILDGLKNEDSAALVLMDKVEEPAPPTTALPDLRASIAKMECGSGTAELSAPVRRALRSLELSLNPAKEVYIVTDMQQLGWTRALKAIAAEFPSGVPLFVVDVGGDVTENLAVSDVDFGIKANVVGTAATCTCRVRNTGSQPVSRKVFLFIGGERVGEALATVNPGATQMVTFRHVFERPGDFSGCVAVDADEMPADNRRWFTVQVVEKLPVLVIDGDPSAIPARDGAFFLRLALQGSANPGSKLSPIEAHVVTEAEAASERFEDYRCVILADVARVEPATAERLKEYVHAGGGVLIFCGEKTDPAAYSESFGAPDSAAGSILPAQLGPVMSAVASPATEPGAAGRTSPFFQIQRMDTSHPIFRDISAETDLGSARIRRCFSVEAAKNGGDASDPKPDPATDLKAIVLVEMDGGPLFLEKKFGAGAVILCTSTCTPVWNNLPLKPQFVPVIHQMVYYLSRASGGARESTTVGTAYHLKLPNTRSPVTVKFYPPAAMPLDKPASAGAVERRAEANFGAAAEVRSAQTAGENRATLQDTGRPGIYRAEFNVAGKSQQLLFAVNTPPEESALDRLPLDKVHDYFDMRNVVLIGDAEHLKSAVRRQREGVPLWDYLLLATIALAVSECFVGNVLIKR